MNVPEVVGANIVYARNLAGLSQGELARRLDVHGKQLSDWERGVHRPQDERLLQIGEIVEQPLNWFFIERGVPA